MIIAIDGPSGTGKSTIAKKLAKTLGFTFFDTGAMYRSFAWMALQQSADVLDRKAVCSLIGDFTYEAKEDASGHLSYWVGGVDVSEEIRTPRVSLAASQIAVYPEVREAVVCMQRNWGKRCNAVFEGRDIGTVVFPKAPLKIFLTARAEVRAQRRLEELKRKFPEGAETFTYETILQEIEERDRKDSMRAASPLRKAPDAIGIDTSDLTVLEVVKKIIKVLPKDHAYPPMKWPYFLVYWMARIFFKICFRLKIYGLSHFRPGPGVIAANHASNYDPPVLSISCPEEVHFLAKEKLFHVPVLKFLIRVLNTHPISRSATDVQTFRLIIDLLRKGKVILFPEGARSQDGALQPLERGLAFVVQKAKCSIFPVYIEGTYAAWPRGKKMPKLFGKISVVFGEPIDFDEFAVLDKKEIQQKILERTEESLRRLQAWLEAGAVGDPP